MDATPEPRVRRYVGLLAVAAVAALFAATLLQLREGVALTWLAAGGALLLFAAFFVLGQASFTFPWRAHRPRMVLDEVALYLGFLALPPPAVPLLVSLCSVLEQARMRRDLAKAVFNLSQNALASGAAALLYVGLRAIGAPPTIAALPATLIYPSVSNLLLAGIFSRLSGEPATR